MRFADWVVLACFVSLAILVPYSCLKVERVTLNEACEEVQTFGEGDIELNVSVDGWIREGGGVQRFVGCEATLTNRSENDVYRFRLMREHEGCHMRDSERQPEHIETTEVGPGQSVTRQCDVCSWSEFNIHVLNAGGAEIGFVPVNRVAHKLINSCGRQ